MQIPSLIAALVLLVFDRLPRSEDSEGKIPSHCSFGFYLCSLGGMSRGDVHLFLSVTFSVRVTFSDNCHVILDCNSADTVDSRLFT